MMSHQSQDFYSYLIQDISKRDRHFETIEKVKYQDNLYFIVYQDDQAQSHLLIYENVHNLWMDNYQFWGESSSSQDIDTFNYADSHQAMVVVYGKNKQNASQYSFVNNGKVYKKEFIGDARRRIEPEDILRTGRLMYATELLTFLLCGGIRLALALVLA